MNKRVNRSDHRSWCRRVALLSQILLCLTGHTASFEVLVEDFEFIPDRVVISAGDTVDWIVNTSEHTVTADDGSFDSIQYFDTLPVGEVFSHTFAKPGTYRYYCSTHGGAGGIGMAGMIVVNPSGNNQKPRTPTNLAPLLGATNQSTSPTLHAGPFSDPDVGEVHTASQWVVRRADNSLIIFDSGEDAKNLTEIKLTNLSGGRSYSWQVRYKDGRSGWSDYSAPSTFSTIPAVTAPGSGLRGDFSNAPNLIPILATITNETISFSWGRERPHRRITADGFSVRWEGYLLPEFSEMYELQVEAKGGVRLWMGSELIINDWHICAYIQNRKAKVHLEAGKPARIRLEYAASNEMPQITLRWRSPSLLLETIPKSRLYPPGALQAYE